MMNLIMLSSACSLIMILCGLWNFIFFFKHLLCTLLSLEFMVLGVFWLLSMQLSGVGQENYFSLFFLVLGACEGVLGLTLLILMVRGCGSDLFLSLNLLEC
uniref:NADH dehydrogenase subunit 4L n=1 Tax=Jonas distinctus TaxID=1550543 RepID=UPI0023F014D7|nr:NADH dehydrogenase subunit 4L [Jonas distinctus]WDV10176.1 NADH dehydrogenase subunit 4L [Jonas distinctus]WOR86760.1 NADH dehydrogenase subunit 4L [Jonas distinctus]